MKKPVVDYREFRFSNINEPRFRHLWLLLGWVGYFALYFITENLIPLEKCTPIHIPLDDLIPFCEYFAVFYVGWYALVFGTLLWYLLYDPGRFRQVQIYIMITQAIAMLCYILWPSRQDLRPEEFLRDNFLVRLMAFIYSFDTSSGVCPSLHVAYSVAIWSVFLKDENASRLWKVLLTVFVLCISASVCFVKQHSALDVFAALPVCLVGELLVFGKWWKAKLKR